jgi:hypothetical protein
MQNYWSRELGRLKNASLSSGTYLMYGDVYVEGNIMNPKSSCTSWMTLFSELSVMSVIRTLKSVKLVTLSGGSDGIHPKNNMQYQVEGFDCAAKFNLGNGGFGIVSFG